MGSSDNSSSLLTLPTRTPTAPSLNLRTTLRPRLRSPPRSESSTRPTMIPPPKRPRRTARPRSPPRVRLSGPASSAGTSMMSGSLKSSSSARALLVLASLPRRSPAAAVALASLTFPIPRPPRRLWTLCRARRLTAEPSSLISPRLATMVADPLATIVVAARIGPSSSTML